MADYYYSDGTQKYGPFTVEQLKSRKLEEDTLVWHDLLPDWKRAGDLPELYPGSHETKTPPPIPVPGASRKSPAYRSARGDEKSFSGILRRYKWVLIWTGFHILAWILSSNEVRHFNNTGAPRTDKFWPFVKYTDAFFTKVQSDPEVWKTQVVFNGFFTEYDWSEFSFYAGAAVFVVILMSVYRKTS